MKVSPKYTAQFVSLLDSHNLDMILGSHLLQICFHSFYPYEKLELICCPYIVAPTQTMRQWDLFLTQHDSYSMGSLKCSSHETKRSEYLIYYYVNVVLTRINFVMHSLYKEVSFIMHTHKLYKKEEKEER